MEGDSPDCWVTEVGADAVVSVAVVDSRAVELCVLVMWISKPSEEAVGSRKEEEGFSAGNGAEGMEGA